MAATATNPYGSTSVEDRVTAISAKDSGLNQMAKTEAAKVMNRRGLLNSSMTVGAATDAVLKSATPIASQDAAQAFTGAETGLDRSAAEKAQAADIANQQTMQAADIANQQKMQDIQVAAEKEMQGTQISADAAKQAADIAASKDLALLDANTQKTLASWNLSSDDRNAAAQFLTNMETMYQTQYEAIMSNEYLDAATRETYLAAASDMRRGLLGLVEQMYNVDLYY